MRPRYKIKIRDTSGVLQAEFVNFDSLVINRRVNAPGNCQLIMDRRHDAIPYFTRDAIVQVYRSVEDLGLDYYLEWEGLNRTFGRQTFENGNKIYTSYSTGYLDLISRRIIAYYAGSAGSSKSAAAETVIKGFVNENAGPGATAPPRLRNGVTPGLTIEADGAAGITWTGARAFNNLLEVLQQISNDTSIFFDVIGQDGAAFLFKTYDGVRGLDRRYLNINPVTGLNAAGNAPAVFNTVLGNASEMNAFENADNQITAVFVLGQGEEDARQIEYVTDSDAVAESPWNLREVSRNATSETTASGLQRVGNAELQEGGAVETFTFQVIQTDGSFYGRHYHFGDYVTGRDDDLQADKFIIGATLNVDASHGEKLSMELADVP